jgi:hypothetical protein
MRCSSFLHSTSYFALHPKSMACGLGKAAGLLCLCVCRIDKKAPKKRPRSSHCSVPIARGFWGRLSRLGPVLGLDSIDTYVARRFALYRIRYKPQLAHRAPGDHLTPCLDRLCLNRLLVGVGLLLVLDTQAIQILI